MSVELLYTSAPSGLKQGSRGFCTVVSTAGTPVNLATRLESLSGYRQLFPTDSPQADQNPVAHSHLRFKMAGNVTSVLSRIAAYGADYSGRTNKIAYHLVVESEEQPAAGPAWLLMQPGIMQTDWDGQCKTPANGPIIPVGNQPVGRCDLWEQFTGDAGWGGVVAAAVTHPKGKPVWIVYDIQQRAELLPLINEVIALLPIAQRWDATFSTYASQLPPDLDCRIRCVVSGTKDANLAAARGTVIRLAPSELTMAGPLIEAARGEHHAVAEPDPTALSDAGGQTSGDPFFDEQLTDNESSDDFGLRDPLSKLPSQFSSGVPIDHGVAEPFINRGVMLPEEESSKGIWLLAGIGVFALLLSFVAIGFLFLREDKIIASTASSTVESPTKEIETVREDVEKEPELEPPIDLDPPGGFLMSNQPPPDSENAASASQESSESPEQKSKTETPSTSVSAIPQSEKDSVNIEKEMDAVAGTASSNTDDVFDLRQIDGTIDLSALARGTFAVVVSIPLPSGAKPQSVAIGSSEDRAILEEDSAPGWIPLMNSKSERFKSVSALSLSSESVVGIAVPENNASVFMRIESTKSVGAFSTRAKQVSNLSSQILTMRSKLKTLAASGKLSSEAKFTIQKVLDVVSDNRNKVVLQCSDVNAQLNTIVSAGKTLRRLSGGRSERINESADMLSRATEQLRDLHNAISDLGSELMSFGDPIDITLHEEVSLLGPVQDGGTIGSKPKKIATLPTQYRVSFRGDE